MKARLTVVAMLLMHSPHGAIAGEPHIAREGVEWCDVLMPNSGRSDLPRVLLIGDSVTRAYFPAVEKDLAGRAYCARIATSKSVGDPALITEITAIMSEEKFDVVHFNNGLHGMGYTEDEYKAAFPGFVEAIRKAAPQAKLIWASSTPLRNDDAKNVRIKARNAIAEVYVRAQAIPIDDQFTLMEPHADLHSDEYHFTPDGSALQAGQVTASILKLMR
jgi:hypothetical protein